MTDWFLYIQVTWSIVNSYAAKMIAVLDVLQRYNR